MSTSQTISVELTNAERNAINTALWFMLNHLAKEPRSGLRIITDRAFFACTEQDIEDMRSAYEKTNSNPFSV